MKPTFPAAARAHTDAGAVAFVEYYWAALNYAMTKPDAQILKGQGLDQCSSCTNFERAAQELVDSQSRYDRPLVTMLGARHIVTIPERTRVIVDLQLENAYRVTQTGVKTDPQGGGKQSRICLTSWDGARWRMYGIGKA